MNPQTPDAVYRHHTFADWRRTIAHLVPDNTLSTWQSELHNPYGLLLKSGDVAEQVTREAQDVVAYSKGVATEKQVALDLPAAAAPNLDATLAELRRLRIEANSNTEAVTEQSATSYANVALGVIQASIDWAESAIRQVTAE